MSSRWKLSPQHQLLEEKTAAIARLKTMRIFLMLDQSRVDSISLVVNTIQRVELARNCVFYIYPSNLTHASSALLFLSYSPPHILVFSCFLFREKTSSYSSELQKQLFDCSKQIFVLKNQRLYACRAKLKIRAGCKPVHPNVHMASFGAWAVVTNMVKTMLRLCCCCFSEPLKPQE